MRATKEEIDKICEKIWKEFNSWNLTYEDLIALSYKGETDRGGDVVYTSPNGNDLTRYMCHSWIRDWKSFHHGFTKCWELWEREIYSDDNDPNKT